MSTLADAASAARPSTGARAAQFVDRWIYVFMAGLFVVTALAGFIPTSIAKIEAVRAGIRPPLPPVLHVHAVLMGSWLMLLLAQSLLVATGRTRFHRQLGMVSFALLPAIVLTGILLIVSVHGQLWHALDITPAGPQRLALEQGLGFANRILLVQLRVGLLFPLLVLLALAARRTDVGTHRRLMVVAAALPLQAGVDRIAWLPTTMPLSPLSIDLYTLLLLSPLFFWDLFRLGRVHRAYLIALAAMIPCSIFPILLWNSPWWFEFAPRLVGVGHG